MIPAGSFPACSQSEPLGPFLKADPQPVSSQPVFLLGITQGHGLEFSSYLGSIAVQSI